MKIVENIAELFGNSEIESITENNADFITFFKSIKKPFKPNKNQLKNALKAVSSRDDFEVDCIFEYQDNCYLNSTNENDIDKFLSDLNTKLNQKESSDSFTIKISIHKNRENGIATVYSLESLVEFWEEDNLIESFTKLQDLTRNVSVLRVYNFDEELQTNCLFFTPYQSDKNAPNSLNRCDLHHKRDTTGHFLNSTQYEFIPEDFNFINTTPKLKKLNTLFTQLKLISSLVYLCDFARFSNDAIHIRLNGYRLFTKDLSTSDKYSKQASNEYYEIYKWVFYEGNIVDKIGLARNIISLHLDNNDLLKIQKNTLQSISSGYQIYLKENVKQYIEIKNKLSEFIQNSSDKASEIVKNIGAYYKGSIWTMYSFFMTVFLIEVIGEDDKSKLITHEIFGLFIVFTVITLFIMNFALKELDSEKIRLTKSYKSLIKRYQDLLLKEDLSKVLGNDEQHIEDIEFIENKRKSYRNLWLKSLAVIIIVITFFWYYGNKASIHSVFHEPSQFIDSP